MDIPYQEINSKTIDRWVEEGWEWGKPVSHEEYEKAKAGTWDVKLTPVKFVPHDWFGDLKGKRVLGLASGGGQQMPIFAALGAQCTVLDYSQRQLDSEKLVAEREGYDITIVRADMTRRLPFDENSFDLIFHPVSNCVGLGWPADIFVKSEYMQLSQQRKRRTVFPLSNSCTS